MKDNVLQSIGDILIINVSPKITGKVTFSEYSDVLIGLTDTRNVTKEFRISADGIFWSDWKDLTNENLSSDNYISDNSLLIQVKYTRIGTDNTGVIEFQDISFFGSRQEIQFVAPTATSSIFSDLLGTTELRQLEENIFKKLYYRGILPKYITRAENSDEKEDNDFIDLFFSVARFFSLIICFSKRFENFKNDFDLMREQVRQYGLYFDEKNINLDDLQYLASHLYDEIRKRGTEMIFKRKGDVLPNGNIVPIDGEFIRLIRSKKSDEILYENMPLQKVGWCLGQSSPMYQGTAQAYHLNKTKEDTQDFIDLNNFVLNKQGNSSFAITTESDGKKVLVGKNNYQNDALTFKTAHHNDLWFHTKDIAGSHVILRCENTPPEEADILFAANLAAHFSKAQNSSNIPVDYTLCRYVKKPSGAKPGFVIFTNQKTLYVTPDQTTMPAILLQDLNK